MKSKNELVQSAEHVLKMIKTRPLEALDWLTNSDYGKQMPKSQRNCLLKYIRIGIMDSLSLTQNEKEFNVAWVDILMEN